ncbi:MAG: transposase [Thermomicrobiales bacterium]|nr:transposase [Thermomicrobiales bacterium]
MPHQKTERRRYSPEFKAAALTRVANGERQVDVANDLDLTPTTLRRWIQQAAASTDPLQHPTYAEVVAQNRALQAKLTQAEEDVAF